MSDRDVLAWVVSEGRIVVTMDKDFGELVYRNQLPHQGVLLLRLDSETGAQKVDALAYFFENFSDELSGRFCLYQNGRFRISG